MKIAKLEKNNIYDAIKLIEKVFFEFSAPNLSKKGQNEFCTFISYHKIIEKYEKNEIIFWGCYNDNLLVGVIALRNTNHISLLFVDKKYHRKGIAKQLFQVAKDFCEKNIKNNKISVNSSPYAIKFYHHLGFIDISNEKVVNGIRFIPMVYYLNSKTNL